MVGESLQFDTGRYFSEHLRKSGLRKVVEEAGHVSIPSAQTRVRQLAKQVIDRSLDPTERLAYERGFEIGGSLALYAVRFVPAQLRRIDAFKLVVAFGNDTTEPTVLGFDSEEHQDAINTLIERSRSETPSIVPLLTNIETSLSHTDEHSAQMVRFTQAGASTTALVLNELYISGTYLR